MHRKKHLSFTSLRKSLSEQIESFPDGRQEGKLSYSQHDSLMSGFACMYFQDPSLLQFQQEMEEAQNRNNLRSLFGVSKIPESTQLKEIIDNIPSTNFRGIFNKYFYQLQRGKHLEEYQFIDGLYLCSIDGTQYFSSEKIQCKKCLTKTHRDGNIHYSHQVLQSAIMHPDKAEVIPLMPEDISNTDGQKKQDIELTASKRLIPKIRKDHPQLGVIIVGDDLYSKQPFIETVKSERMHYILVAKPSDHKIMMRNIELNKTRVKTIERESKERIYKYEWINDIELNGREDTLSTNYFRLQIIKKDKLGNQKITATHSWITDLRVTEQNVEKLVKGGRSRWKIENECFNTLKNQGYHLEHNYGHGEKNLSFNFYLLTLLAFYFHQIFELTDKLYKANRAKFGSKVHMWGTLRTYIKILAFDSWENLLKFALKPEDYKPSWIPPP